MALALSIGVLIAVWVKVGPMLFSSLAIAVPAGIVAWACFFAAGGKTTGLQKTIAANVSGVVWVWLAMTLINMMNMSNLAFVFVGIVAFIVVLQSKIALLSFIPGAFCGAAITAASGAGTNVTANLMVALAMVAGAVLGYVSEMAGGLLAKKA
ncbi:MAG TPA: DUF1097 domain-containing protein [Gemmatimonadales bacterium]|nr:DUF1097 domain-containing protein [Gemmatimonadales bacterium]